MSMKENLTSREERRHGQQPGVLSKQVRQVSGPLEFSDRATASRGDPKTPQSRLERPPHEHAAITPTESTSKLLSTALAGPPNADPIRPLTESARAPAQLPSSISARPPHPRATHIEAQLTPLAANSTRLPFSSTLHTGALSQTPSAGSAELPRSAIARTGAPLQVLPVRSAVLQTVLPETKRGDSAPQHPLVRGGTSLVSREDPEDRPTRQSGVQHERGGTTKTVPPSTGPPHSARATSVAASLPNRDMPRRPRQGQENPVPSSLGGPLRGQPSSVSLTSTPLRARASAPSTRLHRQQGQSRPLTNTLSGPEASGRFKRQRTSPPPKPSQAPGSKSSPESQEVTGPSRRRPHRDADSGPLIESAFSRDPRNRAFHIRIETGFRLAARDTRHAARSAAEFAATLAHNYNNQNPSCRISLRHDGGDGDDYDDDDESKWTLAENHRPIGGSNRNRNSQFKSKSRVDFQLIIRVYINQRRLTKAFRENEIILADCPSLSWLTMARHGP
jgi:hypothetical protein